MEIIWTYNTELKKLWNEISISIFLFYTQMCFIMSIREDDNNEYNKEYKYRKKKKNNNILIQKH